MTIAVDAEGVGALMAGTAALVSALARKQTIGGFRRLERKVERVISTQAEDRRSMAAFAERQDRLAVLQLAHAASPLDTAHRG